MAVSHELAGDGPLFFFSINRDRSGSPFSDAEQAAFSSFIKHAYHHWRERIEIEKSADGLAGWDGYALADGKGRLIHLGRRMAEAFQRELPDWSGTRLPAELVMGDSELLQVISLGRSSRLAIETRGECVVLRLLERASTSGLPPRELGAASLYAQGRSSKEIAAILGLTPATVRTYLRNAYIHLGVRNKFELLAALKGSQMEYLV